MKNLKQTLITSDLTINLNTYDVKKNGDSIKLPHLSFSTLQALVQIAPNTISIDQLIDEVWQDVEVSNETVTQRIALLRKSLNANSDEKIEYISSIRNKGYRWVPDVQQINKNRKLFDIKKSFLLLTPLITLILIWFYASNNNINATNPMQNKPQKSIHIKDEFLQQAWHYLKKHDFKSNKIAIELFRKSLSINPKSDEAMTGISLALSHQVTKYNQPDELLDEAKELAQKAIDLNPDNAYAWEALGFMYDARGDINQAIKLYEKTISLIPKDPSTKGSLAYLYTQKGRLVDAMQLNLSVIDSQQPYLNLQIANTLELLGFDSVAEIWYQKADELSPDNVFATHQMGRFYISQDHNIKAKEIVVSAIDRGIQRPELFILLGIIDWTNNDLSNARNHFKKALEVDDNNIEAQIWNFIASQNSHSSQNDKLQFEQIWLHNLGSWPDAEVYKAIYLAHSHRFDESITSLEKAYHKGYLNHRWLKKLPPFYSLLNHPKFINIIEMMHNDISNQKQQLLDADWLPKSFLDPQKY